MRSIAAGPCIVTKGQKAKSKGIFKVRAIVLNYIGVGSILLDPAVPEIFYFKHDIAASLIIFFIGNPDVDNIGDATLVYPKLTPQLGYATEAF